MSQFKAISLRPPVAAAVVWGKTRLINLDAKPAQISGPLLIHAGARGLLDVAGPACNALVGVVDVVGSFEGSPLYLPTFAARAWPWLESDPLFVGPFVLVCSLAYPFAHPVDCAMSGAAARGLFSLPGAVAVVMNSRRRARA